MTTTADLGLPELAQAQSFPDITFNETILLLQTLAASGVIDKDLTAPPGSPVEGDAYLINTATPTGAWVIHPYCITVYWGNAWRFIPGVNDAGVPIAMGSRQEGLNVWVRDENKRYTWRNTAGSPLAWHWTSLAISATDVENTPAGNISATTIQGAINELDTEKLAIAGHAAASVWGRSANSIGDGADIASSSDDTFLRRVAGVLGWGGVTAGMFSDNTIALARLVNAAAQYDIVGRKTVSAGAWEDCTRTQLNLPGLELSNAFTSTNSLNTSGSPDIVSGNILHAQTGGLARFSISGLASQAQVFAYRSNGSYAVPTALTTNDIAFQFVVGGHNGSALTGGRANLTFTATEPWTTIAQGMRASISGTPNGAVTAQLIATFIPTGGGGELFVGATPTPTGVQGAVSATSFYIAGVPVIDTNRLLNRRQYTFATLPAAGTAGRCAGISDGAAVPVWLAVAAGGGTLKTPVYDNGVAWVNG